MPVRLYLLHLLSSFSAYATSLSNIPPLSLCLHRSVCLSKPSY
jgi:hypothetical protein